MSSLTVSSTAGHSNQNLKFGDLQSDQSSWVVNRCLLNISLQSSEEIKFVLWFCDLNFCPRCIYKCLINSIRCKILPDFHHLNIDSLMMSVHAPFHPSQLWNKCFKEVKMKWNQKSRTQPLSPTWRCWECRGKDTLTLYHHSNHIDKTGESESSTVHTVHPVLHSEHCICCFMTQTVFSNTQKMNWKFDNVGKTGPLRLRATIVIKFRFESLWGGVLLFLSYTELQSEKLRIWHHSTGDPDRGGSVKSSKICIWMKSDSHASICCST